MSVSLAYYLILVLKDGRGESSARHPGGPLVTLAGRVNPPLLSRTKDLRSAISSPSRQPVQMARVTRSARSRLSLDRHAFKSLSSSAFFSSTGRLKNLTRPLGSLCRWTSETGLRSSHLSRFLPWLRQELRVMR